MAIGDSSCRSRSTACSIFFVDVNLAGLMTGGEPLVRLLAALGAAANALLLGWLLYRLAGSRLMAIVAAWLFLMPFYAHQAVLWLAAYSYVFSAFFLLLFLHAGLSAVRQPERSWRWSILALICYAIAIGFGEQAALSVLLVPALALAARPSGVRPALRRSVPVLIAALALAAGLVVFGYTSADMVAGRGGMNLSIRSLLDHTGVFIHRFAQLLLLPNTGLRLTNESFRLGARTLLASPLWLALFVAAGGALLVTVAFWREQDGATRISGQVVAAIASVGLIWLAVTTLLPGILIVKQTLVVRHALRPLPGCGGGRRGVGLGHCTLRPAPGRRASSRAVGRRLPALQHRVHDRLCPRLPGAP